MTELIEIAVAFDSCNGEEADFAGWLNQNANVSAYINDTSETTVDGVRDLDLSNDLWDAYCGDNEGLRDDLITSHISTSKSE